MRGGNQLTAGGTANGITKNKIHALHAQRTIAKAQKRRANKRLTHIASKVAPVAIAVVDVAGGWVPVGASELVTTALAIEIA